MFEEQRVRVRHVGKNTVSQLPACTSNRKLNIKNIHKELI